MKNKTFIEYLSDLRQFIIYTLFIFIIIYLILLIINHIYLNEILNYILLCTDLKSIYYSCVYDKFLFPFSLSYYLTIIITMSIIIVKFLHLLWEKLLITIGLIIFIVINFYIILKYILPYGTKLLFKDILHLNNNSNIIFLPQLMNILHTMLNVILCGILTIYLPIISGLIVNTINIKKKNRNSFFMFFFIIVSGIIAPADPISHLVIAFIMIISFQITIFCGKIKKRICKK